MHRSQTSGSAGTYADASNNGGTTAFSTATETAAITVTDAPLAVDDAYTVAEDTALAQPFFTQPNRPLQGGHRLIRVCASRRQSRFLLAQRCSPLVQSPQPGNTPRQLVQMVRDNHDRRRVGPLDQMAQHVDTGRP